MRIDEIYLFKTPLSNDYKNVYDGYTHKYDFLYFLKNNFDYEVIKSGYDNKRSVKSENNSMQISIKKSATEIYENYNYCCIVEEIDDDYNDLEWRFYFISDVVSLSDVPEKESCLLNLEWDSWHNNYTKLRNNDVQNFIKKSHIETYVGYGTSVTSLNIVTNEQQVSTNSRINGTQLFSEWRILYVRIRFDSDCVTYTEPNSGIPEDGEGTMANKESNTPIAYYPFCVVHSVTREVLPYKYFRFNSSDTQNRTFGLYYDSFFGRIKLSSNIIECDLTFFPQTSYVVNTINSTDVIILQNFGTSAPILDGWVYSNSAQDVAYLGPLIIGDVSNHTTENDTQINFSLIYSINKSELLNFSVNDKIDYEYLSKLSAQYNNYPYNYYSIKCGDTIIPIIPENGTATMNLYINSLDTTQPKFRFKYSTQTEKPVNYVYAMNKGKMILTTDSLSLYNRNNENSLINNKIFNKINTTLSMAPIINGSLLPSVKGVFSGMEYEYSLQAKLEDVNAQRDNILIPTVNCMDDIKFQDDIIIIKNYVSDKRIRKIVLDEFHLHGNNVNYYNKITTNYMHLFDYVLTEDCSLKCIPSLKDRKTLENALNSGITKWHINSSNTTALKNFDTSYYNLTLVQYNHLL